MEAGYDLDEGRFARPVLAYEAVNFPGHDVDVESFKDSTARERLGDVANAHDRFGLVRVHCSCHARWLMLASERNSETSFQVGVR
jgi:hypothetical protein